MPCQPYQPLLLRFLHGIHAILALAGALTGFWIYNTWDRRFGQLSLPSANQNFYYFHLTLGNIFYFFMPAFAVYSLWSGRRRLVQSDSLNRLAHIGTPIWWYTLHRLVNTGILIAAGVALISGQFTLHNGLLRGILSDPWYSLHLVSWVALVMLFTAHLLMIAKVGGVPLLLSMFGSKVRPQEPFAHWLKKLLS